MEIEVDPGSECQITVNRVLLVTFQLFSLLVLLLQFKKIIDPIFIRCWNTHKLGFYKPVFVQFDLGLSLHDDLCQAVSSKLIGTLIVIKCE